MKIQPAYRVQPLSRIDRTRNEERPREGKIIQLDIRPRKVNREEPTWDTPNAARERQELRKMERAMDGVGWTVLILVGLVALLITTVQVGKYFYDW